MLEQPHPRGSAVEPRIVDTRSDTAAPAAFPGDAGVSQALTELRRFALDVLDWRRAEADALAVLRARDGQAVRLLESMLTEYAALGMHVQAQDRRLMKPAAELCNAFVQAFEHVVRLLAPAGVSRAPIARAPDIVVRLLRYREIDLTLALCQYDTWQRARWRSLHDLYRLACEHNIAHARALIGQRGGGDEATVSVEEIYVRTLLLEVAGGGHMLPADLAASRRALSRWVGGLTLQPSSVAGAAPQRGFWLDPAGTGGLARSMAATVRDAFWLDTAPLAAAIDAELASLRGSSEPAAARRVVLLGRLAPLYAPTPPRVKRRGERSPDAATPCEVACGGLDGIYRRLRDEARSRAGKAADAVDEIVISEAGVPGAAGRSDDTAGGTAADATGWQLRDVSESGCRLRGRATDMPAYVPGRLIAFREDADAPWRLGVVRRLRRILGTNVEIGVERLAVGPQRIVLVDPDAPRDPATGKRPRTIAFYLPESAECPRIPIKTLVVPAKEFAPGRVMTMATPSRELVVRLREPLESQADFVWTSFEFVDGTP